MVVADSLYHNIMAIIHFKNCVYLLLFSRLIKPTHFILCWLRKFSWFVFWQDYDFYFFLFASSHTAVTTAKVFLVKRISSFITNHSAPTESVLFLVAGFTCTPVTGISLAIETDAMFVLSTNSAFLPVTQVHTVSLKCVFLSNLFLRADTEMLVI